MILIKIFLSNSFFSLSFQDSIRSLGIFYGRNRPRDVVFPKDPDISEDEALDDDDDLDDDVRDPNYYPVEEVILGAYNEDGEDADVSTCSKTSTPEPSPKHRQKKKGPIKTIMVVEESSLEVHPIEDNPDDPQPSTSSEPTPKRRRTSKQKKSIMVVEEQQAQVREAAKAKKTSNWKKNEDISHPPLPEYIHEAPLFVPDPYVYFRNFFNDGLMEHISYQSNLYATQKSVNTTFTTSPQEIMNFIAILLYMGVMPLPSLDDYWSLKTRVPQVANLMSSKRFHLLRRTIHFNDNSQIESTVDRFYKVRPIFTKLREEFLKIPQTPKQSVDEVMIGYKDKTARNLRQYIKNKPTMSGIKLFSRASSDGIIHDMIMYQGATTFPSHTVPLDEDEKKMSLSSKVVSVLARSMTSKNATGIYADIPCPSVIMSDNCNMGGIDKSDMLVQLYKTPMKSKRWYLRLFAYCIDLSLVNAWLLYKRDCASLKKKWIPLKNFRLDVYSSASACNALYNRANLTRNHPACKEVELRPPTLQGQRSEQPDISVRFDTTLFHCPLYSGNQQTCKNCSVKGHVMRSNFVCSVCKIHLCVNKASNCFRDFHNPVA